jgi:hypothetical protein
MFLARTPGNRVGSRRLAASPDLERLEERLLLYATSGGKWAFGSRITYSLIPDGTSIGGVPSILFQTMNAKFSTAVWESQIQKAAAAWEAVANINIAQVTDDGEAIAVNGNQQDSPNFGDIRIGGMLQTSGQLAFTYATPPFNGGTLAGDMFFNTDTSWQVNATNYDLETVALHEFGHALGMAHSPLMTAAVMYAFYNNAKQSLTADDISGIQSIYGGPAPDAFDTPTNNNLFQTAAVITSSIGSNNQLAIGGLTIKGTYDPDWYFITAPPTTTSTMAVSVQSANLSSLSPGVFVYDSSLRLLGKTLDPGSYGATATFSVGSVVAGNGYYIKVVGADSGPSGQGGYGLLVNFSALSQSPIAPPNTVVTQQPDHGGGGSPDGGGNGSDGHNHDGEGSSDHGNGHNHGGGDGGDQHGDDGSDGGAELEMITVGSVSGLGDPLMIADSATGAPTGSNGASAGSAAVSAPSDASFVVFAPDFTSGANSGPLAIDPGAGSGHLGTSAHAVDLVLQDWDHVRAGP